MPVMAKTITLSEANQAFSRVIREVEAGEEFTITRDGEPVARLVPVRRERVLTPEQQAARARALERMEKGWHLGGGGSTATKYMTRSSGVMMEAAAASRALRSTAICSSILSIKASRCKASACPQIVYKVLRTSTAG